MAHCHVLGEVNGPADARIMFVGEAPGRHGAGRSGVPFSGDESGRRFEALLGVAGLRREDVFVTNAVLCNPLDGAGNNRRPLAREVRACLANLRGQIEAVDPDYVVALGGRGAGCARAHRGARGDAGVWVWRAATVVRADVGCAVSPGAAGDCASECCEAQEGDWRRLGEAVGRTGT